VTTSNELVAKLWRLCTLLRKDGVTYPQYVTELTYLMFLKLVSERIIEGETLSGDIGWGNIVDAPDDIILERYRATLTALGTGAQGKLMRAIFHRAESVVRDPTTLRRLVDAIDEAEWYTEDRDWFGDAYEGLLQKNAEETKRGAGQYFTPRVLVDTIVDLMHPKPGEVIQDPAAGTGGFLIAAKRAIELGSPARSGTGDAASFCGVENVADTYRLLCMNLYLHGIDPLRMFMGDTLSQLGAEPSLRDADLILSNPPFGASGGVPTRDDLPITARSTSFQLPFVEHCMRALAPGGRAAVIVPDNILFEGGRGRTLRQALMQSCDLHTILRLPTRIFYAQGVRTNVLFFHRPAEPRPTGETRQVWIYDMRANVAIGERGAAVLASGLQEFAAAYGDDPLGRADRVDTGPDGRFRCFSREEIAARDDDLYIAWLRDNDDIDQGLEFAAPDDVAIVIEQHLMLALDEIRALMGDLDDEIADDDLA
jgi:type I restriction enzyme M protein